MYPHLPTEYLKEYNNKLYQRKVTNIRLGIKLNMSEEGADNGGYRKIRK